jgi:hypothetical protein
LPTFILFPLHTPRFPWEIVIGTLLAYPALPNMRENEMVQNVGAYAYPWPSYQVGTSGGASAAAPSSANESSDFASKVFSADGTPTAAAPVSGGGSPFSTNLQAFMLELQQMIGGGASSAASTAQSPNGTTADASGMSTATASGQTASVDAADGTQCTTGTQQVGGGHHHHHRHHGGDSGGTGQAASQSDANKLVADLYAMLQSNGTAAGTTTGGSATGTTMGAAAAAGTTGTAAGQNAANTLAQDLLQAIRSYGSPKNASANGVVSPTSATA